MTIAPTEEATRAAKPAMSKAQLVALKPPRLPFHEAVEERFGIDRAGWKALVEAIYPNAETADAIVMALSYCRARNLDPFKRPVHIVPMWSSGAGKMIETVWPGISEFCTTAYSDTPTDNVAPQSNLNAAVRSSCSRHVSPRRGDQRWHFRRGHTLRQLGERGSPRRFGPRCTSPDAAWSARVCRLRPAFSPLQRRRNPCGDAIP
jgi:hypothetical protein